MLGHLLELSVSALGIAETLDQVGVLGQDIILIDEDRILVASIWFS